MHVFLGEQQVHCPLKMSCRCLLLQLGVDRQDDVGEQAVVLEPGMLGQDELDVGVPQGSDEALLSFQQVIQQGESVQIMWISEHPSAG